MKTPLEFFGFEPGADREMLHWHDIVKYFYHLEENSPKIKVENMGKSSEGQDFLCVYISSEHNIKHLEEYRQISRKLADPRGLSEDEKEDLISRGKTVFYHQLGLHSNEVGGTQCSPALAYELISDESPKNLEMLENTIMIMVPCGNPEGAIDFHDWYYLNKNTPNEGSCSPHLRHKYAGHSNNRDAAHVNLIETYYINKILTEWVPQAFLDQHHACPNMDRFTIAPFANPSNEETSPLLIRESQWLGGSLSAELSREGVKGVVCGGDYLKNFDGWTFFSPLALARNANIIALLTESADALIATPIYVHPELLATNSHIVHSFECPEPWEGGWWHLSDIVKQMKIAAKSTMQFLSHNREEILRNMTIKALSQTQRGKEDPVQAMLIPRKQHDASALKQFMRVLSNHNIEICELAEPFGQFDEGTIAVPLAQPLYAMVKILLEKTRYPANMFTTMSDGSVKAFDGASINISDPMGIEVFPAGQPVKLRKGFAPVYTPDELMASENDSYRKANEMINKGVAVYRDENGNFNTDGIGKQVIIPKIGIVIFDNENNCEEGFTRLLFENYNFPYKMVPEHDIVNGALDDVDIFIIPGEKDEKLQVCLNTPERYAKLREFVLRGGRVVAWGESCDFVAKLIGSPLSCGCKSIDITQLNSDGTADFNKGSDLGLAKLNAQSSTLRVNYEPSKFTYGMPQKGVALYYNVPIMHVMDRRLGYKYHTFARFAKSDLLSSGYLIGEQYLANKPCGMHIDGDNGDAVLYAFDPKFRCQTDGTYKLLFNALYKEI